MKPSGWIELLIAAVIAILAALYPLVASNLMLGHGVDAMMYIALATSWVLFSGPTHYISLATAAFFGVGGFLVGTGMSDYQTSFWSMLALSGIVGAVLAALIGFATLRGGNVVGDHSVIFAADDERIELSHKAGDRTIFARGAVHAAQWAHGQAPGYYTMADVLGF